MYRQAYNLKTQLFAATACLFYNCHWKQKLCPQNSENSLELFMKMICFYVQHGLDFCLSLNI